MSNINHNPISQVTTKVNTSLFSVFLLFSFFNSIWRWYCISKNLGWDFPDLTLDKKIRIWIRPCREIGSDFYHFYIREAVKNTRFNVFTRIQRTPRFICFLWHLYWMVVKDTVRTYGVNQVFRFVEGIWLHRMIRQIRFFFLGKGLFYFIRVQHVLRYHLIKVAWLYPYTLVIKKL